MKTFFFACASFLFLASCSTQKLIISNKTTALEPVYKNSSTFWIGGIGQTTQMALKEGEKLCSKGIGYYQTRQSPLDVLFSFITFSIYTPREVAVYCVE